MRRRGKAARTRRQPSPTLPRNTADLGREAYVNKHALPSAPRARTVRAENLPLYAGCEWQEVEEIGERLPDRRAAVFSEAFVVEPVHLPAGVGRASLHFEHHEQEAGAIQTDRHHMS